jgi:8-oxo-dGTP pyrophosphatase MutT (NUDIX family)
MNHPSLELTEEHITARLQAAYRPGVIASSDGFADLEAGAGLKCAAVLVALARREGEWHLLYTRRTEAVEHHKGQVSFPGGGCEDGETAPEQTALREAEEEIGLVAGQVRLLGRLNDILTITNFRVTPVVGVIAWPSRFRLEPAEVERVFTIPLAWLRCSENWVEQPMTPDGIQRPVPVLTYKKYDDELLWGVSARITHNFLQVLGLLPVA